MENYDVDKNIGIEGRSVLPRPPRLTFNILGNEVNLEEFLSSDWKKRDAARVWLSNLKLEEQRPDEEAAECLVRGLEKSHVTIEEYKETMPKLLQFAAKEGGGFDKDFISVTVREFDRTWARMTDGQSIDRFGSVNFDKHIENRREFFARAYGRVEAIKDFIWDDPVMAAKKEQLIENANFVLKNTRPNYPRSLF